MSRYRTLRRLTEVPLLLGTAAVLGLAWRLRATRAGVPARRRGPGGPALVVLAGAALALAPWTVGIATLLPDTAAARHWNTAWTGIDIGIMSGLAATAWLHRRLDRRAGLTAAGTASLMCADAWFDLCTSAPGAALGWAAAEAVAELAVAGLCLAVGYRAVTDPGAADRG